MDNSTFLIGMGANLNSDVGTPADTLVYALKELSKNGFHIRAVSRFYRSAAFPAGSGPDYVNAVTSVSGNGSAEEVLALCHRIEAGLGRQRESRWASRGVDLDLLAAGERIAPDRATEEHWRRLPLAAQMRDWPAGLILPHPRLAERAFVLIPLAEIAPDWRHPVTGLDVATMAAALPEAEKAALRPFSRPFDREGRLSSTLDGPK